MGSVILVASGKGGVGKTTITANVAACLDKFGSKVLLLDADIQLNNLDIVLGLTDKTVFDIEDLYLKRCPFEKTLLNHPLHNNLFFVPGPQRLTSDVKSFFKFIINLAVAQTKNFDYILVDCPSGIGTALNEMTDEAVKMIVVATPDPLSVRDAEKTAELAYKKNLSDVRLIVNRVRPGLIRRGLAPDIDSIIDSTSVRLLGLVPEDIKVIINENQGILLTDLKRSRAKRAFENIASRIQGENIELYKFW